MLLSFTPHHRHLVSLSQKAGTRFTVQQTAEAQGCTSHSFVTNTETSLHGGIRSLLRRSNMSNYSWRECTIVRQVRPLRPAVPNTKKSSARANNRNARERLLTDTPLVRNKNWQNTSHIDSGSTTSYQRGINDKHVPVKTKMWWWWWYSWTVR